MSEALYKWLDGNRATHGGTGEWRKNRWRSVRGELVPCRNGLHLCREQDLLKWLAPTLWMAEHDGELVETRDKVVVRRARVVERLDGWNNRTAQLFAADCAERVLPLFEEVFPNDDRPRLAIQAARDNANGLITAAEAAEAARAAWAAWAAEAAEAARAAWAAWDTRDTRAAEYEWQTARLLDYAYGRIT